MKKLALLVGALAVLTFSAPVMAQSFTDVPTDHWAYTAVQDLADKGYMVGYPDGTFGGKRALTRYEFAMAISRVIAQINKNTPAGGVSQADFNAAVARIDALAGQKAAPAPAGVSQSDLEKVSRLVGEFRDELSTLGVDVDALKRDVADLRTRTEALEGIVDKMPKFSGEANIIARGESTRCGKLTPFDADGRFISPGDNLLQGVRALYDLDLNMTGKIGKDATYKATINYGNYLNWLKQTGGVSVAPLGQFSPTDAAEEVSLWLAYINTPINLGPLGAANLTVGKMPFQLTPYTFKMLDVDSYTYNQKTDSGDYPVFGAEVAGKVGPVGVTAFAAKNNGNVPQLVGQFGLPIGVDQSAGIRATVGTPFAGNLAATYILTGNNANALDERLAIYGADLSLVPFKNIGLNASWTRTRYQNEDGDVLPGFDDSDAWDARLNIPVGKVNVEAGYRQIDPNFDAPGSWGKIGNIFNPVDIEGPLVNLNMAVCKKMSFSASGEFYKGTDGNFYNSNYGFLTSDDKLDRYQAGVKYAFSSDNNVDLGIEHIRYTPDGADTEKINFINLGVGHNFSPNASLKLMYQIATDEIPNALKAEGQIAVTQFSVKF